VKRTLALASCWKVKQEGGIGSTINFDIEPVAYNGTSITRDLKAVVPSGSQWETTKRVADGS
jgi:hypothetical protein